MTRVVAVTTSMGTKWEAYSQALLAHHVPEWDRVVVDGRRNWSSTRFLAEVVNRDADYIVHVDEDCFVQSRHALLDVIDHFEQDQGLVAAGVPDGGHYYREHNPAALNLFFVIFRMRAVRLAWSRRPEWGAARYQPEYSAEVLRQFPGMDRQRVAWNEAEPYYGLFWTMMAEGGRFLYLGQDLNRDRWSTRVLSPGGVLIAEHLWYLRQWFSQETMPGHDCPNVLRYKAFESELLSRQRIPPGFRRIVARMNVRRLWRRAFT